MTLQSSTSQNYGSIGIEVEKPEFEHIEGVYSEDGSGQEEDRVQPFVKKTIIEKEKKSRKRKKPTKPKETREQSEKVEEEAIKKDGEPRKKRIL